MNSLPQCLCTLLLVSCSWGQETGEANAPEPQDGPIRARYRAEIPYVRQTDTGIELFLIGAVKIEYGATTIRCDNAICWGRNVEEIDPTGKRSAHLEIVEVFADGIVRLESGTQAIECHQLFLDIVRNRGVFLEATLGTVVPVRDAEVRLRIRAAELRQLSGNLYEMADASITTSPFAKPGYRVETSSLLVQIDPLSELPDGLLRNVRFELDSSVLYVGDLPVFAFPAITGNTATPLGQQYSYIKSIHLEDSREFGPSVRLTLGDDIFIDDTRWGEWRAHTQYLWDRGAGFGFDLLYKTEAYRGSLETLYQNDRGQDQLFGNPPDDDRGRIRWQQRTQLPEHVQMDIEFSWLSDEGFLPEYYEGEFKSEKEQETLIYFKRMLDNQSLTLLAKKRVNRFLDKVEHMPQFGYDLIHEPLANIGDTTVYFDADYEFTDARRVFRRDSGIAPYDTWRLDLDNKVGVALNSGPIRIMPFVGMRYTKYGEGSTSANSTDRLGSLYGVHLTTELWKIFDVRGGFLDLFGLRHIVTPEIEYRVVDHVSHDPTNFLQFDDIDAHTEEEALSFGLRNRLQTIWEIGREKEVVDVLDLDIEWTYFPQAARDNFNHHAGNIDVDLLFRPSQAVSFLTDFEYSFVLDTFEVLNAMLGWAPDRTIQLALGYRRYVDVNDAMIAHANWRPTEKWGLVLNTSFDFVESALMDQELRLQRIGADWVFELRVGYDFGHNGIDFGISFTPRVLFDPRLRDRFLRNEPLFATFGDGLIR